MKDLQLAAAMHVADFFVAMLEIVVHRHSEYNIGIHRCLVCAYPDTRSPVAPRRTVACAAIDP